MIKYNSLYAKIPDELAQEIVAYSDKLIDIYDLKELETNPHVTVKYGIHTNDVEEVAKALGRFIPIRIMFGKTSFFTASEVMPYDVIKIDIFSQTLKRLNKKVTENLKVTNTHPIYVPHLTLAYVEAGSSLTYLGFSPFIGMKVVVEELIFSRTDGKQYIITKDGDINEKV